MIGMARADAKRIRHFESGGSLKIIATSLLTGVGSPLRIAGLNRHFLKHSMAFSSSPLPRLLVTLISDGTPSIPIIAERCTEPSSFASSASGVYSGGNPLDELRECTVPNGTTTPSPIATSLCPHASNGEQ